MGFQKGGFSSEAQRQMEIQRQQITELAKAFAIAGGIFLTAAVIGGSFLARETPAEASEKSPAVTAQQR